MTILVNELHVGTDFYDTTLIQVADRRITDTNGKILECRRKIFEIPHLKASVGYFGLAQATNRLFFSEMVPQIIQAGEQLRTIKDFAYHFESELNKRVNKELLKEHFSGFHLCGFALDGIPEFYYIRNIKQMNGIYYDGKLDHYYLTEDFRRRHVRPSPMSEIKRYKDSLTTPAASAQPPGPTGINKAYCYANGDLTAFWNYWGATENFFDKAASIKGFVRPITISEQAKWKLEQLSSFYNSFANKKIVGDSIDVIEIRNFKDT